MKVRSKESGKVYDIDALFVKGGELILPLSEVEVLTEDQPYDYEALRNELAAKLFTILVKSNDNDVASVGAIEDANEFIRQLKKSPVE
jgi:hypothetical protein